MLHEGLTKITALSFGVITAIVGVVVLLLWIPLRERPGLGTVANVLVIAVVVDIALAAISTPGPWGSGCCSGGVLANGLATACYVGARLGPGPRDGLMTGLVHRAGWPLRWVRTGIEVTVLALGWLLGGTVGIGTVLYALAVGPLTQAFLPRVVVRDRAPA